MIPPLATVNPLIFRFVLLEGHVNGTSRQNDWSCPALDSAGEFMLVTVPVGVV
jgi:hypothetical protein